MFYEDDVSAEDLEAVAGFYNSIVSGDNPDQQAIVIAQEQFGICIKGHILLDRVLSIYACSNLCIEDSVINVLQSAGFMRLFD